MDCCMGSQSVLRGLQLPLKGKPSSLNFGCYRLMVESGVVYGG